MARTNTSFRKIDLIGELLWATLIVGPMLVAAFMVGGAMGIAMVSTMLILIARALRS